MAKSKNQVITIEEYIEKRFKNMVGQYPSIVEMERVSMGTVTLRPWPHLGDIDYDKQVLTPEKIRELCNPTQDYNVDNPIHTKIEFRLGIQAWNKQPVRIASSVISFTPLGDKTYCFDYACNDAIDATLLVVNGREIKQAFILTRHNGELYTCAFELEDFCMLSRHYIFQDFDEWGIFTVFNKTLDLLCVGGIKGSPDLRSAKLPKITYSVKRKDGEPHPPIFFDSYEEEDKDEEPQPDPIDDVVDIKLKTIKQIQTAHAVSVSIDDEAE